MYYDHNSTISSFVGNPVDVKWLKTALHKGTSKDRSNAGALLVQTNPVANLETLETLIGFTKVTNKNSTDTVGEYLIDWNVDSLTGRCEAI